MIASPGIFVLIATWLLLSTCAPSNPMDPAILRVIDRERTLEAAEGYLKEEPQTITAFACPRSAGGLHDFYSEGDYWWPDPEDPGGPYIRRDGQTNPENFKEHRRALVRFGIQVPTLVAATRITGDTRYARHAIRHLQAWFIEPDTRMRPALEYAQAISGRVTGRGVGIIDTIHLVEVAVATRWLIQQGFLAGEEAELIRSWFREYVYWMTTHPYGLDERDRLNNHGSCWVLQVTAFAGVAGEDSLVSMCRQRLEDVLLPAQLAADGSFPRELARTKPYGYSLFNLDILAGCFQLLSWTDREVWSIQTREGAGLADAVAWMQPFIADKSTWPFEKDVMYWDEWPVRQPSLLFAGLAYGRREWVQLWKGLDADPSVEEIIRNFPIRNPILWYTDD